MENKEVERILKKPMSQRTILPWEDYAMKFQWIPNTLVNQNIEMKSILRCRYKGNVYYFNIGTPEIEITDEMKKRGGWKVYAWAD